MTRPQPGAVESRRAQPDAASVREGLIEDLEKRVRLVQLAMTVAIASTFAGCGSDNDTAMPDVVGQRLDVAQSEIERAGFEDDVEIVGGGVFGVIDESNWQVCEQLPKAGSAISDKPRLTVERSCDKAADSEPTNEPTEEPTPEQSAEPTEEPSEEPTTDQTAQPSEPPQGGTATKSEVLEAFRNYIGERADSGVLVAKAATKVTLKNRTLRVVFDPAAVGMDRKAFDEANPFNNPYDPDESLADFVSTPITLGTNPALRLRKAIDKIVTVYADGTPEGSRTTAEIIELNGLDG